MSLSKSIRHVITTSSTRTRGIHCRFYELQEYPTIGIKVYREKEIAEATRDRQNEISSYGLAPKVGSRVRQSLDYCFWYLTEKVQVISTIIDYYASNYISMYRGQRLSYRQDILPLKYVVDYNRLRDKLVNIGFNVEDLHHHNVGYLRGKLVVLDVMGDRFTVH